MIYFKNLFFLLASFNSISKTSGANTLFSIDWAPHRRPEIRVSREFESRGCLLDMCDYWVQDGTNLKPVLTILYITTEQRWGGRAEGASPAVGLASPQLLTRAIM